MSLDKKYEDVEHSQENVVKAIQICIKGLKTKALQREKNILLEVFGALLGRFTSTTACRRAEDKGEYY